MRIKNQSKRRTSSQHTENKFKRSGEQVLSIRRTCSKLAEMRIKENSLAQQKRIPFGKRVPPFSPHFAKGCRRMVTFLAAS